MTFRTRIAVVATLLLAPLTASAHDKPVAAKPKDIDLVICLDVSNSMDGLIDSAKLKLWDIVNELAKVKPVPNLRVALYSYGHNSYPADKGWVRKDLDLTVDLDEVYAKLTALKTSGGNEYVARVTQAALGEQKWSEGDSLKLIFVCGNEPVDQDKQLGLTDVAAEAKRRGVFVNTIYCGPTASSEANGWRNFSTVAGGSYANIDQDRAKRDTAASVKTPYDADILKLSDKLNTTYLAYGKDGKAGAEKQIAQDRAAGAAAPGAALARGESKANALYRNSHWDLIDRMNDDPKFDLSKVKEEDLPDDMKKMKPEERVAYLKKKAAERAAIQKEINDLSAKRAKVIDEERKKQPKSEGEKALDEAVKGIIRDQAKSKGIEVPTGEKTGEAKK